MVFSRDKHSSLISMPNESSSNVDMAQDLAEQFNSMTSRLKRNFRSTTCSGHSFPSFNRLLCRENLPLELQELILTQLPALKLVELKAVCRSWKDLLQSSSFKEKWQLMREGCGNETLDVWVMKSEEGEDLIAYVPALRKYVFFLSLICSSAVMTQLPAFTFMIKEASFLCACGPLIVLGKKDWRSNPSFCMFDLDTGQRINIKNLRLQMGGRNGPYFVSLSSFPLLIQDKDQPFCALAVETQSVDENGCHLLIYRFATNTWTSHLQSSATQADFNDMSAVLCGDFFQYVQEDSTLYAWSSQHWSKVRIAFSSPLHDPIQYAEATAFKVVKCEGHILLLTSTVQQEGGVAAQCITIWKLMKGAEEPASWNWFEISKTPPELCLKSFNQESFSQPTSMCDGHHICIISSSHEFSPALVYDVKHGSWYHLQGVWKDMRALFAMKLSIKVDVL